ncbi:DUF4197 domain-containing protein [Sphingobacterium oryzagri]|uniref:DUF4197 domain-containing protein n=1 Tax=Sphingobacterium oryzagri TaxID=3025669 RepID=A0ABY7WG38_9SPHI|nr:DUF4197 domain-containing protein [Sphingobacterium sp. KACC 22765]WDF68435.1 DUF4197 domain-containing protein [Sphingobacterium sp. KACC 22765]
MKIFVICAAALLLGNLSVSQAQVSSKIKDVLGKLGTSSTDSTKKATTTTNASVSNSPVTKTEANNALKQALSNGLQTSIKSLSVQNGYLGDAVVKILMPEEAQKVEKALRAVGMGSLCDQFITSMNRAAETAVSEAGTVFVNSLSKMTIQDGYNILLSEQQNAATNYFRTNTNAELTTKFTPVIESAMGKNQVSTYWTQLTTAYNKLPLSSKVNTDLTAYVTQKAIDGLFVKVADQELKIRQNLGGARSTELLSKVFGWVDSQ